MFDHKIKHGYVAGDPVEAAVEMAKIMRPPPLELLGKPVECPVRFIMCPNHPGHFSAPNRRASASAAHGHVTTLPVLLWLQIYGTLSGSITVANRVLPRATA